MSCSGCKQVRVEVRDPRGSIVFSATGSLANGGSLSLPNPVHLDTGSTMRLFHEGESWNVSSVKSSRGGRGRYTYHVDLRVIR
jgi:hypothetical protein